MNKFCLYFLAGFIFLFWVQSPAWAKLYINEFYSYTTGDDWVELYNSGSEEINLENYCLRDGSDSGNEKRLNGGLPSEAFQVIQWDGKLNRPDDVIKIYFGCDKTKSPEDQVSYGKSDSDVAAPQEGQTAGRLNDGGEEWVLFSEATKGEANSALPIPTATPDPTETPVPSNTPTPSKIPTPTKMPTSTKAPSPTKSPTPAKAPTATRTPTPVNITNLRDTSVSSSKNKLSSKSVKANIEPTSRKSQITLSDDILGISTKSAISSKSARKNNNKPQVIIAGSTSSDFSFLIIPAVVSVFFIASAIIFFLRIRHRGRISDET